MKLFDTLLLFSALGWLIISIDSIIRGNIQQDYWMLMFALGSFFYYIFRRNGKKEDQQNKD